MGDKEGMIHIYYTAGQNVLIKVSLVNNILGGKVLQEGQAEGLFSFTDSNAPVSVTAAASMLSGPVKWVPVTESDRWSFSSAIQW